jgi:hypothetical protein
MRMSPAGPELLERVETAWAGARDSGESKNEAAASALRGML